MHKCRFDGKACETASWYDEALNPGKVRMIERLCQRCWRASKASSEGSNLDEAEKPVQAKTRYPGASRGEGSN